MRVLRCQKLPPSPLVPTSHVAKREVTAETLRRAIQPSAKSRAPAGADGVGHVFGPGDIHPGQAVAWRVPVPSPWSSSSRSTFPERHAMTKSGRLEPVAAEITPRTEISIDGKYRAALSGATFDSINPAHR